MYEHLQHETIRAARFLAALLRLAFPRAEDLLEFADVLEPGASAYLEARTADAAAWSHVMWLQKTGSLNLADEAQIAGFIREVFFHAKVVQWGDILELARQHGQSVEASAPVRPPGEALMVLDAPALSLSERHAFLKALSEATGFEYQVEAYRIAAHRTYLTLRSSSAGSAALRRLGKARLTRVTGRPVWRVVRKGSAVAVLLALLWDSLRSQATTGLVVTILGVTITVLAIHSTDRSVQGQPSLTTHTSTSYAPGPASEGPATLMADSAEAPPSPTAVPADVVPAPTLAIIAAVPDSVPGNVVPEEVKRATWAALCESVNYGAHTWHFRETFGGTTWFLDTFLRGHFFPRGGPSKGTNYIRKVLKDLSGIAVFGAPPSGQPRFTRWTPEIVQWVVHNFVPEPDAVICGKDVRAVALYETAFQDYFRMAAVTLFFHVENDTFSQVSPKSYSYKGCMAAARGPCAGPVLKRYTAFTEDLRWGVRNRGDDWTDVEHPTYHFWIRRHVDGSLGEFQRALQQIMRQYDPNFWRANEDRFNRLQASRAGAPLP